MVTWTDIKIGFLQFDEYVRENIVGISGFAFAALVILTSFNGDEEKSAIYLVGLVLVLIGERILKEIADTKDRILCEHEYNRSCVKEEVVGV